MLVDFSPKTEEFARKLFRKNEERARILPVSSVGITLDKASKI